MGRRSGTGASSLYGTKKDLGASFLYETTRDFFRFSSFSRRVLWALMDLHTSKTWRS